MIPRTLAEIADAVGGSIHGPADLVVSGPAYVDSRTPVDGGLFVAVVGEHVDGHQYADHAHAVLGSRPTGAPTIVVDDVVPALGRLARHVVDRLDATVLALTGSQGKTGTKDYLAGVLATLAGADRVVATAANNNNEIGVPLTVLRATGDTAYLVVEMGARGIGHIGYLCSIAPPDVAAVLNVGSAHVGEFGSREAIARAKGEIVESLAPSGVAVLNADDPLTTGMASRTAARTVSFGTHGDVSWREVRLDELGRPSFELGFDGQWHPVTLQQSGGHQVANAAAAAAMAIATGLAAADVAAALSGVAAASPWRMEVGRRDDGMVVVNDAYNANPESMRAALEALVAIGRSGGRRTIAVLGEMKELGAEHLDGHRAVGRVAAELGVDVVVVVGEAAAGISDGAQDVADAAPQVVPVPGREEAVAWVRHNAGAGDAVLVKASRGAALEWVARQLLDDADGRGER
ncbi:UDP-N-acetylmuramoyl-tripeptide--D-alanyl-D-alanine ligase [Nocardioides panacisoli]|uniref:UDP-N-acetylmuramoyl-tripeptide--D-alanyl-D-alanine ligase n=1 Tax=Nocardioides panacisoli TaxID=627624 RepID=A0ABP7I8T8_9ACTN